MFRRRVISAAAVGIMAIGLTVGVRAYATYARWGSNTVTFYINPASAEVSADSVEASLVDGMQVWNTQSGTPLQIEYGGRVGDTSTSNDGRNVVIFRNSGDGSAIASTYSWWSGTTMMDSDIIFWDGPFTFFGGSSGCGGYNAAYITDIAAHEFGHAIGLNHATDGSATMYPGYSTCSLEQRTLAADDIAGVRSLYGTAVAPPTNTAPSVSIVTPANNASYVEGTSIVFSGTANDSQDGNLASSLWWSSNVDGQLGSGGSFSRTLSRGTHVITATATDTGGMTTSRQATVTVMAAGAATLTAKGTKQKNVQRVDLRWSGFASTSIDVYRNGSIVMAGTANDGTASDSIRSKSSANYVYVVCAKGSSICSNSATVVF